MFNCYSLFLSFFLSLSLSLFLCLQKGDLAIYYDLEENKSTEQRGIVEIDSSSGKWVWLLSMTC